MTLTRKVQLESDIYAELYCDKCGNEHALYLGNNLDDFYIYADSFLDQRYFNYDK